MARLSVTGELGYEIYVPAPYLAPLFDVTIAASQAFNARHVGVYALNSGFRKTIRAFAEASERYPFIQFEHLTIKQLILKALKDELFPHN